MKLLVCIVLFATALHAQWLRHPTPGIPRTPDGRPDFAARTPRTADGKPDFSGLWQIGPNRGGSNFTSGLKPEEIQPRAKALQQARADNLYRDSPSAKCLPAGPLASVASFEPIRFVQTPGLIVILHSDLSFRQIFLDGRTLEKSPNPSWMGFSVGHWEEDVLVVESNGYNDQSWLDFEGNPHSEALRMTERFHRPNFGSVDVQITFEDPEIYARPLRVETSMRAVPDTELLEYVCAENERDRSHLIGALSDDRNIELPAELLSKYAGRYALKNPAVPGIIPITVALEGAHLTVDHPTFGRMPLRPISRTTFTALGTTVRFAEEAGVLSVTFSAVEGDFKALRVQ
jgi:hypothetical protein